MKIIDPHLHLFDLKQGAYDWLKPENPPHWPNKQILRRDCNESSLKLNQQIELVGYVHIEAGFDNDASWKEAALWEKQSTRNYKAIQNADLTASPEEFIADLQTGLHCASIVGVRHIIENERLLAHPNTLKNLKRLAESNLIFELQCDLANSVLVNSYLSLIEQIPTLNVSINHLGFIPKSDSIAFKSWLSHFRSFVQHPHIGVKISGLEMRSPYFNTDDIMRMLDPCLTEAPIYTLMMASNFPVVTMAYSYANYWDMVIEAVNHFGAETHVLVAQNAQHYYFDRHIKQDQIHI